MTKKQTKETYRKAHNREPSLTMQSPNLYTSTSSTRHRMIDGKGRGAKGKDPIAVTRLSTHQEGLTRKPQSSGALQRDHNTAMTRAPPFTTAPTSQQTEPPRMKNSLQMPIPKRRNNTSRGHEDRIPRQENLLPGVSGTLTGHHEQILFLPTLMLCHLLIHLMIMTLIL